MVANKDSTTCVDNSVSSIKTQLGTTQHPFNFINAHNLNPPVLDFPLLLGINSVLSLSGPPPLVLTNYPNNCVQVTLSSKHSQ